MPLIVPHVSLDPLGIRLLISVQSLFRWKQWPDYYCFFKFTNSFWRTNPFISIQSDLRRRCQLGFRDHPANIHVECSSTRRKSLRTIHQALERRGLHARVWLRSIFGQRMKKQESWDVRVPRGMPRRTGLPDHLGCFSLILSLDQERSKCSFAQFEIESCRLAAFSAFDQLD